MADHYLACDLGAESGRLMAGALEGERLEMKEIHRFPNGAVESAGSLVWNIGGLWGELEKGLRVASRLNLPFGSISTDSWGVDYILFSKEGRMLEPVYHYRDRRAEQGVARALARVDREMIFAETGIQFMPINTLFQLASEERHRLESAGVLLGIADGFNYLLSGRGVAEESLASTTQLYNPLARSWSRRLLEKLELPSQLFPPIVPSGTRLGTLKAELAERSGLGGIEVIATCSHDTGAAVAAVPALNERAWAYISSGTWSLIGVELDQPLLTEECRAANFTNELGYGGTVRLLKNIVGLWILQECRRHWAAEGKKFSYEELARLAEEADFSVPLIDPGDSRFLTPGGMPAKIAGYCGETGQPEPQTPGQTVRCVLQSLALSYAAALRTIEQLTGKTMEVIHIVGGGSRNSLLNQLTANAAGAPVVAGPVEATAAGNLLAQALALGHLPSLPAARRVVERSFPLLTYEPAEIEAWKREQDRFQEIIAQRVKPS
jgi:rhamnulokinase